MYILYTCTWKHKLCMPICFWFGQKLLDHQLNSRHPIKLYKLSFINGVCPKINRLASSSSYSDSCFFGASFVIIDLLIHTTFNYWNPCGFHKISRHQRNSMVITFIVVNIIILCHCCVCENWRERKTACSPLWVQVRNSSCRVCLFVLSTRSWLVNIHVPLIIVV